MGLSVWSDWGCPFSAVDGKSHSDVRRRGRDELRFIFLEARRAGFTSQPENKKETLTEKAQAMLAGARIARSKARAPASVLQYFLDPRLEVTDLSA